MNLGIGNFTYDDLYSHARLRDMALTFDRFVEEHDAALFARFDAYRQAVQSRTTHGLTTPEESALLIAVGRELALFLTQLFGIDAEVAALRERTQRESEVARFKKEFVTKRVVKVQSPAPVDDVDPIATEADPELALAIAANRLLDLEKQSPDEARPALDALAQWTAAQWKSGRFEGWTSFRLPKPLVFDRLVPTEPVDEHRFGGDHHEFRRRDGFHLTDERMSTREIT